MAEYKGKYKSVYIPGFEFETDYIAREAARDLMYHNQYPLTEYDLNDLPSADVRPVRRGRWERVDPRSTVVTFRCSECNYYAHINATNFCPNCGAEMDGES